MEQFPFPPFGNSQSIIAAGGFHPNADRACEACNKKKTKCDKELPICGLCSRTNHECIYPTSRKRPSRQDPEAKAKIQKINGNIDRLLEILETNPTNETDAIRTNQGNGAQVTASSRSQSLYATGNGSTSLATPSHTPPAVDGGRGDAQGRNDVNPPPVSYELATHLLDVYFDKLQPWLGIFHKPTFMQWTDKVLSKGSDALKGLDILDLMIFNGMFAMAARFSEHNTFASTIPRDRGERFAKVSASCVKIVEDIEEPTIQFVQACLLLAVYQYGSGHSQRGRTVALLCIRACYDLRLHEIDDTEDDEDLSDEEWIDLELQRRVFWSTWECDLFGSILKRRPFGIDWRHIRVNMPVDDEAWFTGERVQSAKFKPGPECWKTLSGVPNQSGRAWMLLTKSMIGWLSDMALLRNGVTKEQKEGLENNISCFRLALPNSYSLSSTELHNPEVSLITKNYIIASNIYICASAFTASQLPVTDDPITRTQQELDDDEATRYRSRSLELCQVMKNWPPECLLYAPPSHACALLTFNESVAKLVPPNELDTSYKDLSNLILSKFAERWTLAALMVRIRDLAHAPDTIQADDPANATLLKEYPAYFNKVFIAKDRRRKLRGSTEAHRTSTLEGKSKSLHKSPSDGAVPQSKSPDWGDATISSVPAAPPPNIAFDPSSLMDNFSGTTSPDSMGDNSMLDPAAIPGFSSIEGLTGSPHDFDAIFSGFLQEPLWQDFQSINFLV